MKKIVLIITILLLIAFKTFCYRDTAQHPTNVSEAQGSTIFGQIGYAGEYGSADNVEWDAEKKLFKGGPYRGPGRNYLFPNRESPYAGFTKGSKKEKIYYIVNQSGLDLSVGLGHSGLCKKIHVDVPAKMIWELIQRGDQFECDFQQVTLKEYKKHGKQLNPPGEVNFTKKTKNSFIVFIKDGDKTNIFDIKVVDTQDKDKIYAQYPKVNKK